jgi:hypothetical protein
MYRVYSVSTDNILMCICEYTVWRKRCTIEHLCVLLVVDGVKSWPRRKLLLTGRGGKECRRKNGKLRVRKLTLQIMRVVGEFSKVLHQFTREEICLEVHVPSLTELLLQTYEKKQKDGRSPWRKFLYFECN